MHKRKQILQEALKHGDQKSLGKEAFLDAWKAVAFLNPGLHPDEFENPDDGWPEELKPLAEEAFRRFEIGEFSDGELYCYKDAMKGIKARSMSSTDWDMEVGARKDNADI